MSKGKVVVLGINGHIGRAVAEAFVAAGWSVSGMGRNNKSPVAGVEFISGDAESVEAMRRAIGDAEVVVHALNLPYHTWFNGRMEGQMARVLEAVGTSGKTLLFPASIYNYAASDRVVTPDLPQHPQTPRGALRVRLEEMFEAATARGDIQGIILRAGEFYGPGTTMDWFDQVVFKDIGKGKVAVMGAPGVAHAWAYLPDLARSFEALASLRGTFGPLERFHFAGNFVTPEEMGAAIAKAAPAPIKVGRFPLLMLKIGGLFDAMTRELGKMSYLWRNPMRLADSRLDSLLGAGFNTPFETAVATAAAPFFERLPR